MEEKAKKKFYQKWWFWVIVAVVLIGAIDSCGGDSDTSQTKSSEAEVVATADTSALQKEYSDKEICTLLLYATENDVGENEMITSIQFEEGKLVVNVDISSSDPAPFTYADIAGSRASSITDTILDHPEFDKYWTSVIVDFEDIGYYEGDKSMIVETDYGRYFEFPIEPIEGASTVTETTSESTSNIPLGMSNALRTAKDYLAYTSFSKSGLFEQLEYEGYTSEECEYGVENCGADWSVQAELKTFEYIAYSSFSEIGLVDQLEYEGFTTEEAAHGVDVCGADWNEQAILKAQEYLAYSAFSKSGLIDQLEFEGFTKAQAEYGVNNCGKSGR